MFGLNIRDIRAFSEKKKKKKKKKKKIGKVRAHKKVGKSRACLKAYKYHCCRANSYCLCLFVLRFYGPVNPMGSCRARSVYLTTRLLGMLSSLSG